MSIKSNSIAKMGLRSLWVIIVFGSPFWCYAQDNLPTALASVIKQSGFDTSGIGLYIREVDAEQPLVTFQASKRLNPASVIKLVTTATALGILGSGYRWSTDVRYTGTVTHNTLNGDLYFRGNGDPYMTPERFWRMLNRIAIFGIRNIHGDIYLDNSYFDPGKIDYAAFDEQPFRTYNVGPNALLVGFQATEFHFSAAGNRVEIIPFPASPKLRVVNKVKLVNGSCGAWQKRITIATKTHKDLLRVTFSGRYAKACDKRTLYRRVTEAQDHFQHYFLPLWKQIGGSLDGRIRRHAMPSGAKPVLQEDSISLSEAIRLINKFSNNVMTRQVLLTIGAQKYGPPGTTAKGVKAVRTWLDEQGLNSASLQLDNGAGLSRNTRVSAEFLGKLLYYVFQQAYMPEFVASLPVSGYDGSMAHRFTSGAITGHAHIKTGLLDFVQTMAGYVTAANGQRYIVSLLHNDPLAHTKAAERLQDKIIQWVYNLRTSKR